MNADLFGHAQIRREFQDIRNTRPSVAEEKAALCLELVELCRTAPKSIANGSVDAVRKFLGELARSRKVLNKKTSSANDLRGAIANIKRFHEGNA